MRAWQHFGLLRQSGRCVQVELLNAPGSPLRRRAADLTVTGRLDRAACLEPQNVLTQHNRKARSMERRDFWPIFRRFGHELLQAQLARRRRQRFEQLRPHVGDSIAGCQPRRDESDDGTRHGRARAHLRKTARRVRRDDGVIAAIVQRKESRQRRLERARRRA